MILRLPFPRPAATTPPDSHRVTSQCLEIAGWTHDDCVEGWCRCSCHALRQGGGGVLSPRAVSVPALSGTRPAGDPSDLALDAWRGGAS